MGWLGRLFDRRDTFVRLLLLDVSGVGYLIFGTPSSGERTGPQWVLAVIAFAGILALYRTPLISLLVQIVLLEVAFQLIDNATINQVGAAWALLELAMWARRPRTIWLGTGLLVAVYLVNTIGDPLFRITAEIFGLAAVIGLPVLLGLVIRTSRELGRQAEQRAAEQQRRLESENRAARAEERSTIARELHDVVAHHVASIVLRIGVARHVLPDVDPRVAEVFHDVHQTGTTALADLRRLVELLRNPDGLRRDAALTAIDPAALPAALSTAVDTARRSGLVVESDISPSVGTLDAVRGLAVLRLTQEALTNVAKHAAQSAHARLSVAVIDGEVHWQVTDDGGAPGPAGGVGSSNGSGNSNAGGTGGRSESVTCPAARADRLPVGGHGLTGMRERVEVLGGQLDAGPSGGGWHVRTTLPAPTESTTTTPPSSTSPITPTATPTRPEPA
jgi:signal transduction histidine kinase